MRTLLRKRTLLPLTLAGRYLPAILLVILAVGGVVAGILVKPWTPTHIMGLGRFGGIAVCLLMLLVARALARGKRQAWLLSVGWLAVLVVDSFVNRGARTIIPFALGLLLTFIILAPLFRARSDPTALARGYVALFIGSVALYSHAILFALLHHVTRQLFMPMYIVHVAAYFLVGFGVIEVLRPVLPRHMAQDTEATRVRSVVIRYGTRSLAHYTLGPGMSYFWADSGQAFLAYQVHRGIAVMLGDPIGHESDLGNLVQRFWAFCRKQDWELAIYQASPTTLAYLASGGLHAVKIGEEAILSTSTFTLQGKVGAPVRHAIARALRGNVTVSLWQGETIPEQIFAGMKRINTAWLQEQHTYTQMGFSMGCFPADWSPDLLTAVAQGQDDEVLAFLTWTPLYRGNGWTLDNMRRSQQTVPGTMEYLIAESVEWARVRGYSSMSLSLAPLAGLREEIQRIDEPMTSPGWRPSHSARLFQQSAAYLHRRGLLLGNYRSLYFFKQKFQPTWEPRFLVLSDAAVLPRVLIALAVVHGMNWRTAAHEFLAAVRLSSSG